MTTKVDNERQQILEDLHRYERGVGEAPTLYSLGFALKASYTSDAPMQFVASTEDVDRMGDVIRQDGWQLDEFRKNSVFMWQHTYSIPPIGSIPRIWVENKQLRHTVLFDQKDEFARSIENKYRSGFLSAVSVGFRPTEFEIADDGHGRIFTAQDLLEVSAVGIPANADALRLRSLSSNVRSFASGWAENPFDRVARLLAQRAAGSLSRDDSQRIRKAIRSVMK